MEENLPVAPVRPGPPSLPSVPGRPPLPVAPVLPSRPSRPSNPCGPCVPEGGATNTLQVRDLVVARIFLPLVVNSGKLSWTNDYIFH